MELVEDLLHGDQEEEAWGTTLQHAIAGGIAGTVEHCGMFPLDTIKTHLQAYREPSTSMRPTGPIQTAKDIVRSTGVKGLFRGISAVATGAAPAHAVYFATYEFTKTLFGGHREGHQPVATALAGVCATIASDGIFVPADSIKQKMQLHAGTKYSGISDCIRQTLSREGIRRGLYGGFTTTLTMNVPYVGIYFASYESLKKVAIYNFHYDGSSSIVHLCAGAGAGICAAAFTNPLDVAKTRLQTQAETGRQYEGMVPTLKTIWKEEGASVFLRGILPRIAFHSTSAALCWTTYEYCKFILKKCST